MRAFDARTGEPRWTFSIMPQSADDPAAATWENESWRNGSHANVWAPMALDEARGLLYVPTSTPNNDYYGGTRPGANLYAESLVCLDAATGKVKWHFQTVHHGHLGLRRAYAAEPRDDHRERQADRRGCAGHETGLHVRLRSRHRHADLAHRGARRCRPRPTFPVRRCIRRSPSPRSRPPLSARASRSTTRTT